MSIKKSNSIYYTLKLVLTLYFTLLICANGFSVQQQPKSTKKKVNSTKKARKPIKIKEIDSGTIPPKLKLIENPEDTIVKNQPNIIPYPDVQPEFPGGNEASQEYIRLNLKYPQNAIDLGIEGKVFVQFTVTNTGSITDVKVLKGISEGGINEEAIRLVKNMPNWKPGLLNGVLVPAYVKIAILFQMR